MFPININPQHPCHYCLRIAKSEPEYPIRHGIFTVDNFIRRCGVHAQFKCNTCSKFRHFSDLYYCNTQRRMTCFKCTEARMHGVLFWDRRYAFYTDCNCGERHFDLMYEEYRGNHPLQKDMRLEARSEVTEVWYTAPREGQEIPFEQINRTENNVIKLVRQMGDITLHTDIVPQEQVDQSSTQERWEEAGDVWIDPSLDENGDVNRELIIDPELMDMIGDVMGQEVLDAGCGNGYLTRRLAMRGARVTGVDQSQAFIEHCMRREVEEPLGCKFLQRDLADLHTIPDRCFDVVVSNIVLVDVKEYRKAFKEIARVLRDGGRFVWSNVHPVFGHPGTTDFKLPFDTPRREDRIGKLSDRYFDSGAVLESWGRNPPLWQFPRTLTEYSGALRNAGLTILEIREPIPRQKVLTENPHLLFDAERFPHFIIFECRKD